MSKYIDAEKLKAEIERLKEETFIGISEYDKGLENGRMEVLTSLQSTIDSLQQEQPEHVKGKFVFPNFLYARTVDNKTIDVSYAPQSLDAIEYIRKDIVDETVKTAEDHAYFAGQEKFREKLIEWLRYEKEWFEGTDIEPHYQKIIDKLNSIV